MTLPDSDRMWLSFGAKYSLSKVSSLDFGYSHIFFDDARTAKPVVGSTGIPLQTINGKWDNNSANLLSAARTTTTSETGSNSKINGACGRRFLCRRGQAPSRVSTCLPGTNRLRGTPVLPSIRLTIRNAPGTRGARSSHQRHNPFTPVHETGLKRDAMNKRLLAGTGTGRAAAVRRGAGHLPHGNQAAPRCHRGRKEAACHRPLRTQRASCWRTARIPRGRRGTAARSARL
jgi:hypothetical protein